LTSANQPPAKDDIEVAVFGPGIGEAILIHCGDGEWICVDCAMTDGKCWPLQYLREMGFQAQACVRLVVATHWHTDHVRGLTELLTECVRAQFVCSSALRADEFRQIVARFSSEESGAPRAPLADVRKSFELLAKKEKRRDVSYRPPIFASAHSVLDSFNIGAMPIIVMALSPSPEDHLNALRAFAGYFIPLDQPATGLSPITPNHASVVLSIQIGDEFLLLGADLERTRSQLTGWNAIVASTTRPQQLSILFKIPHHGSSNAQSEDVWKNMLVPSAFAAVTLYTPSGLPNGDQIRWLCEKSPNVFSTGVPTSGRVRRRAEVERTIRESTISFTTRTLPTQPGVVRFRKTAGASAAWRVEMFGEAMRLAV
jgi:beta-lactamase superfamily II metal-dependent hydrolase